MSLKLIAEMNRLKTEVSELREQVEKAVQRPHTVSDLMKKVDALQASIATILAESDEGEEDEKGEKKPKARRTKSHA